MKKLIGLTLIVLSHISYAAEWTLIESAKNGVRWYSSESFDLPDGTIRTYLKAEGRNINIQPFAILIDCKTRSVRNYVPGTFGSEFYEPWQPIAPDSAGEIAYRTFCKKI